MLPRVIVSRASGFSRASDDVIILDSSIDSRLWTGVGKDHIVEYCRDRSKDTKCA